MKTDTATFTLTRNLRGSQDKIWSLLTDAKHRENWGVPDPSMVLEVEKADLKVGGHERHRCGPAEAPEFLVDTRWYDLQEPTTATFTETLIFGGAPAGTSLVTYALEAKGETTDLHVTVATASFTGPETLGEIEAGWNGGLDTLVSYAAQQENPS